MLRCGDPFSHPLVVLMPIQTQELTRTTHGASRLKCCGCYCLHAMDGFRLTLSAISGKLISELPHGAADIHKAHGVGLEVVQHGITEHQLV